MIEFVLSFFMAIAATEVAVDVGTKAYNYAEPKVQAGVDFTPEYFHSSGVSDRGVVFTSLTIPSPKASSTQPIHPHITKFIDNNREAFAIWVLHQMTDQRCFARAEKPSDHRHWQFGQFSHGGPQ